MTFGSRTRTGCLTCRLRKKKCDEQRPECQSCQYRQLTCYGFKDPLPSWYIDKANWKEVKNSDEAKNLRALAETRYKIQRKIGFEKSVSDFGIALADAVDWDDRGDHHGFRLGSGSTADGISTISTLATRVEIAPNTWQLSPGTVWWNNTMKNLTSDSTSSVRQDTRLLMIFLDIIHPISHGFYRLSCSRDRSWLLNRLAGDQALYNAALSVSACFEHSLTQQPKINDIGICPKVRSLQSMSIHELHLRIDAFGTREYASLQDFIFTGIRLLDVVLNLINLEIFSMLQGSWEMHYRAARTLMNHLENFSLPDISNIVGPKPSSIESAISLLPAGDERRRTLEFCITNFVWIDVIATATFGLLSYTTTAFDYIYLLLKDKIKPQDAMGCQGWIMANIVEIAKLERWKAMQHDHMDLSSASAEVMRRASQLATKLKSGVERLEGEECKSSTLVGPDRDEDSRLVSIIWAYAAQVFLQATILGTDHTRPYIDRALINICIQKLEELPSRLVRHICWPYTIVGCMSTSEYYARFRQIFARTMQRSQPPGITWKGLMVMEECWRLRQIHGRTEIGWREAMDSLGARVLLV